MYIVMISMLYVMLTVILFFFFFKQKTAYEMRISDWSFRRVLFRSSVAIHVLATDAGVGDDVGHCRNTPLEGSILPCCYAAGLRASMTRRLLRDVRKREVFIARLRLDRSEEHTSELQSLMRISYAVFCLKQKNTNQQYCYTTISNTTRAVGKQRIALIL